MKFSISQLKELIKTSYSTDEIAQTLTSLGLEVESLTRNNQHLCDFTVAKIIDCQAHPNSDKLKVCKVMVDENCPELQIVCGASNARSGIKVAYAKIGSLIPANQMVIKNAKIAGVESQGMLCSAKELMINNDDQGIIEIDDFYPIKTQLSEVFKDICDDIIEIYVTPNRSDCLGLFGIARDLSAKGIGELIAPKVNHIDQDFVSKININNLANQNCDYILFREISGISNFQSPQWLIDKITSFGITPVSAIVDILNLVTHLTSQPLHAYDYSKINGDLSIRLSKDKEHFQSLKGQDYQLDNNDLVISDQEKILSLAGIIGSSNSAIDFNTNHIIIESASFNADVIAKTGRKHNIISDARYRFERVSDSNNCKFGLDLASNLIKEICSTQNTKYGNVISLGNIKPQRIITFDFALIKKLIGIEISQDQAINILQKLGFKCNNNQVIIPSYRSDINIEQDLVEEIIRIYGYEQIIKTPIKINHQKSIRHNKSNNNYDLQIEYNNSINLNYYLTKIRQKLSNRKINEVINWSFVDSNLIDLFSSVNPNLILKNPVSLEMNYLRPTLAIQLLKNCKNNQSRNFYDLSLFEIGNIFHHQNHQQISVAGIRIGKTKPEDHYQDNREFDVFDIKADMIACIEALDLKINNIEFDNKEPIKYFHPHRFSSIKLGKKTLANFGEIHPSINLAMDIKNRVNYFEIFIDDQLINKKSNNFKPYLVSDMPMVERDFAFLVDQDLPVNNLIKSIINIDKNLINEVIIFDIFRSPTLPQNKKSVALKVKMQSSLKTLTTEEIDQLSKKIIDDLAKQFQAVIRS